AYRLLHSERGGGQECLAVSAAGAGRRRAAGGGGRAVRRGNPRRGDRQCDCRAPVCDAMTRAILPLAVAFLLAASPYTGRAAAGVAQGAVLRRVEGRPKYMAYEFAGRGPKLRLVRRAGHGRRSELEGSDRTHETAQRLLLGPTAD